MALVMLENPFSDWIDEFFMKQQPILLICFLTASVILTFCSFRKFRSKYIDDDFSTITPQFVSEEYCTVFNSKVIYKTYESNPGNFSKANPYRNKKIDCLIFDFIQETFLLLNKYSH